MAVQTITYQRSFTGNAPYLFVAKVGATAVKMGDFVKLGATKDVVIPITASTDKILGMVLHDAAIGAQVSLIIANGETIFKVKSSAAKKFVNGTSNWVVCDFDTFTSGAMTADPATATNSQMTMIELASGEADNTNGNYFYAVVQNRYLDK
jgi:hypothetical protein